MKKQVASILLSLSLALPLAGCGTDIGIISAGPDGPAEVIADGSDFGASGGTIDLPEAPAQAAEPEAGPEPEDYAPAEIEDTAPIDEDGTYNSVEDVSLYLYVYGRLPDNYITKNEARDLGWTGGSVEQVAPGYAIGGDRFGNREGVLPEGSYHECDIDTIGEHSRGAKRLVYEDDGAIYYTEDHYESFIQIVFYEGEDGKLVMEYGEG